MMKYERPAGLSYAPGSRKRINWGHGVGRRGLWGIGKRASFWINGESTFPVFFVSDRASIEGRGGGRVRGIFLLLVGFVFVGIGASLYYGALDLGSLTKNGATQQTGSPLAFLPAGLGVVLIAAGISLAILDRRAAR